MAPESVVAIAVLTNLSCVGQVEDLSNSFGIEIELVDQRFSVVEADLYKKVESVIGQRSIRQEQSIRLATDIFNLLEFNGIKSCVFGRAKGINSTYEKTLRHGINLHEIFDLCGVRVLVRSSDLRLASDLLLQSFMLMPSYQFKNSEDAHNPNRVISKDNGYKALHLNFLINENDQPLQSNIFEVQICTVEDYQDMLNIVHEAYQLDSVYYDG